MKAKELKCWPEVQKIFDIYIKNFFQRSVIGDAIGSACVYVYDSKCCAVGHMMTDEFKKSLLEDPEIRKLNSGASYHGLIKRFQDASFLKEEFKEIVPFEVGGIPLGTRLQVGGIPLGTRLQVIHDNSKSSEEIKSKIESLGEDEITKA